MLRGTCTALLAIAVCGCTTSRPRDYLLNPKPAGSKLTMLGYWGPGARITVDNRVDLEKGASQLESKLQGDTNFGFAGASAHVDVRVMVLSLGASAGYRYGWHTLTFEPNARGFDHGERELNIDARRRKDEDDDFDADHWPWGEGRARLALPFHHNFLALSTVAFRYNDRRDNSYDWEHGTVFDKGHIWRWETLMFLRHWSYGFIGPAARFLNVPRQGQRTNELQYGIAGGTRPGFTTSNDALILRLYTTAGFDTKLFGAHFYNIPIQVILGYQFEVDF